MAEKEVVLMKGNEAIAHAAIRCGCAISVTPLLPSRKYWKRWLWKNRGKRREWSYCKPKAKWLP